MHTGVDFAAPVGTPVLAALAGRVVLAEPLSGYGLTVVLDHGQGLQTLYAHLQVIGVTAGSQIDQGGELGLVGMTGVATGPHLHFELRSLASGTLAHDPTPHLPPLLPPPALTAAMPNR
jgi:murein DD-endopeptidase MepM/ murein hydrolase activator NlpD